MSINLLPTVPSPNTGYRKQLDGAGSFVAERNAHAMKSKCQSIILVI